MEQLKWSAVKEMWCVQPTKHTNYLDVVDWCHDRLGKHTIEQQRDGVWSYCTGAYYGIMRRYRRDSELLDQRLYFGFIDKEDALAFILRWC